jgi:hypothetical protein
MALETAKRREKKDVVGEIEFKLGDVELKLSQLRRSKTQVTEGSCLLIYTIKLRDALQGPECCSLLPTVPPPYPMPSNVQDLQMNLIRRFNCNS